MTYIPLFMILGVCLYLFEAARWIAAAGLLLVVLCRVRR
jgi:hypothetical protein